MTDLTSQACRGSCSSTGLDTKAIDRLFKRLNGWELNKQQHLYKKYNFIDFAKAMRFACLIGELAEKENHHPDLKISWGYCEVEIWTHKIQNLTENDFILAAKIDLVSHENL